MKSKNLPLPKQNDPSATPGPLRIACALRLLLLLLLTLPAVVQAQFTYETNNGTITITGYTGPGGAVSIPATINGLPVASIGDYAFYGLTNLASVTIPSSVTSIGEDAFWGCRSMTAMAVDADNSVYSSGDGVLFDKSRTALIQCPQGKTGNYTILSSVTSIGYGAFSGCTSLASVTIPSSVTSIGDYAFSYCTSLTAISVEVNNSAYSSVDGVLFNRNRTTLIQCPGGKTGNYTILSVLNIRNGAFLGCTSLTGVTIPYGVTSIGDGTFLGCFSLKSVTIPSSATSIGQQAFADCTSLTSVTIPSSVTYIGYYAFSGCTSLKGGYFQGNAPSVGSVVFDGDNAATIFYLPGTTGWGPTFGGRPTALWTPQFQVSDASFGVRTNQFGFSINWASGRVVVVEACTDLTQSIWAPVGTNTLTDGSSYFSDPQWTNYPARFYRLRSP